MFAIWQAQNPHPTTELHYTNAYQLLVAVVCSAQTTDVAVNKAFAPVFAHITTPAAMVAWGEDNLRHAIRSIGLYHTKAKHVLELSRQLVAHHGGQVPRAAAALEALPGVGRKTANVVRNTLWGDPVIAVDTHVFRLAHRLGLSRAATPQAVGEELEKVVPEPYRRDAHHWLILHGRYVCTARAPACATCAVAAWCQSPEKTRAHTTR